MPERRRASASSRRLEHHAVIGQAGQRVLAGQLAHRLGAAIERPREPPRGARRREARTSASAAPTAPTRPQSQSIARTSARSAAQLNQPMMRPCASCSDCTSRPASRVGSASKRRSLQAGATLDQPQLAVVERVDIAEHRMQIHRAPAAAPRAARPRDGLRVELRDGKTDRRRRRSSRRRETPATNERSARGFGSLRFGADELRRLTPSAAGAPPTISGLPQRPSYSRPVQETPRPKLSAHD